MQIPKLEIWSYFNLAWRRKWWIIIPLILSVLGGAAFLKVSPKTYRASTLILLEPQSIPDSFVRSTITESVESRLRTITQQINSRTNLEKIVKDFQLDEKSSSTFQLEWVHKLGKHIPFLDSWISSREQSPHSDSGVFMGLLDQLRNNLQVTMRSGTPGSGGAGREQSVAFEISFQWKDPDIVAPVTNAVASRFIQENLNVREEIAISTTDFLEQETALIRNELEARERELETFKKEHMGMLPDQLESNINVMNQLRDQLLSLQRSLDQEKQQALLLKSQAQMARIERDALANSIRQEQGRTGGTRRDQQLTTEELTSGSLEELETELRRLSTAYTEKHPDVIALKRRIDSMKKEGIRAASGNTPSTPDTGMDRISVQLVPINANIESYKNQIREVERQLQTYKERVERTPQVEMALNKILRDYETVQQRYDDLLKKKLDAKLAEQMEKRKKGEQFRVLDPAIRPPKPFKPDAKRVMAMAFALGLGLGCGLAYLREMLDPAFYNPEDVAAFLELPIMVSIPMADMEKEV
jgi:polysaccharide chain length determinant protein (PEP-CTERM system associated)